MADFAPSSVRITKAELLADNNDSRDILSLIVSIDFAQSIESPFWTATAKILDNIGLLENWPLRGEERLLLELIGDDLGTRVELEAQLFKVDNVMANQNSAGLFYDIHFVSKTTFAAAKRSVLEPHKSSCSQAVKAIFEKYYSKTRDVVETEVELKNETLAYDVKKYNIREYVDKKIYIQPTEGQIKAVIPNLVPSAAIDFLAQRSYSKQSASSSFRFFETFDGYFFVTDEFLIKKAIDNKTQIKTMGYGSYSTKDPLDPIGQIETIISLQNPQRINVTQDIMNGGYRNNAIEIDIMRRTAKMRQFDYSKKGDFLDMEGKVRKLRDDTHTDEYIKSTFTKENAMRFIVFRDYQQPGDNPGDVRPDQYFTEIISNRVSHAHHMSKLSVIATLNGRIDIMPGNVLEVKVSEFNTAREDQENEKLGGNYLVHSVNNNIAAGNCETTLNLIKYG